LPKEVVSRKCAFSAEFRWRITDEYRSKKKRNEGKKNHPENKIILHWEVGKAIKLNN